MSKRSDTAMPRWLAFGIIMLTMTVCVYAQPVDSKRIVPLDRRHDSLGIQKRGEVCRTVILFRQDTVFVPWKYPFQLPPFFSRDPEAVDFDWKKYPYCYRYFIFDNRYLVAYSLSPYQVRKSLSSYWINRSYVVDIFNPGKVYRVKFKNRIPVHFDMDACVAFFHSEESATCIEREDMYLMD